MRRVRVASRFLSVAMSATFLALLLGCGGGGGGDGGSQVEDREALAQAFLNLVNQERQGQGLTALTRNAALDQVARDFARQIAQAQQANFDANHTGPDGKTAGQRIQGSGYGPVRWGENLAWSGGDSAQAAIDLWMNSPAHRAHILDPDFKDTGVGVAYNPAGGQFKYWWVQEFGAR